MARGREGSSSKPLLDKLGVRPEFRVAILGLQDEAFRRELERVPHVEIARLRKHLDVIFFAADSRAQLQRLGRLKEYLKLDGAIWVISLKGKAARIRDTEVIAAAIKAGLVDNKVVSFSQTRTALRLVIPLALRRSRTRKD